MSNIQREPLFYYDLAFQKSMKSDRSATFSAKDENLANKINRKRKSQEIEEKGVRKEQERYALVSTTSMQANKSDEERETDADNDSNDDECDVRASTYQQKRSHHRKTLVRTTAFILPRATQTCFIGHEVKDVSSRSSLLYSGCNGRSWRRHIENFIIIFFCC